MTNLPVAPTPPPLRCHLLIGPPGSGKTTLAKDLAPLLKGDSGKPGLVLSTDAIRAELFGDASVQGPGTRSAPCCCAASMMPWQQVDR